MSCALPGRPCRLASYELTSFDANCRGNGASAAFEAVEVRPAPWHTASSTTRLYRRRRIGLSVRGVADARGSRPALERRHTSLRARATQCSRTSGVQRRGEVGAVPGDRRHCGIMDVGGQETDRCRGPAERGLTFARIRQLVDDQDLVAGLWHEMVPTEPIEPRTVFVENTSRRRVSSPTPVCLKATGWPAAARRRVNRRESRRNHAGGR